jgi:probable F420-dependent oxidoreductase
VVRRPVRVGVQFPQYDTDYPGIRAAAVAAEAAGVDAVFTWDHFFGPGPASDARHLECWTLLAAMAEVTSEVEVGPLVTCTAYRNPDLLADMARTVDHISAGRLVLGLGAGFKERDFLEYGFDYGSPRRRVEEFATAVARSEARLGRLHPPPVRAIPLLIGGGGPAMLRLVARHATIWHTFAEGEDFAARNRALEAHCAALGRPSAAIERSVLVGGRPEDVGAALLRQGVTLFVLLARSPRYDLGPVLEWLDWRDEENCSDPSAGDARVADAIAADGGVADGGVADGGVADGGVADGGVADGGVAGRVRPPD